MISSALRYVISVCESDLWKNSLPGPNPHMGLRYAGFDHLSFVQRYAQIVYHDLSKT